MARAQTQTQQKQQWTSEQDGAGVQAAAATPAGAPERAARSDSFACPKCKKPGCPRTGDRATRFGKVRFRKCSDPKCGHTFSTFEGFASGSASALSGVETVRR